MLSKLAFAYIGFFAISSALSINALFDVQDLCAFLTIDCLLAVSVFCRPVFDQYCTCIRADLDLNVAILLDASIGVQTASVWADITLAIPAALQLEIQVLEPLLDLNILAFGDGNVLDLNANLNIAFPGYSSPTVCPALLQAVAALSVGGPDLIVLVVWANLDLTGCDFSLLANLRIYILSLGLNLDFSAFIAGIIGHGGSVTVVNCCSSLLCLQSLLLGLNLDISVELIVSILGDLFCEIFVGTTTTHAVTTTSTAAITTTRAPVTPAPVTPAPVSAPITPAPVIPPQEITPSPTRRPTPSTWLPTRRPTARPTWLPTRRPTLPTKRPTQLPTKRPTLPTPAPITPLQQITPAPTRRPTNRPTSRWL